MCNPFLISPRSSTGGGVCGLGKGMVYNEACYRSWFGSLCSGQLLTEVKAAPSSTEAVSLSRWPGKCVPVTTSFLFMGSLFLFATLSFLFPHICWYHMHVTCFPSPSPHKKNLLSTYCEPGTCLVLTIEQ